MKYILLDGGFGNNLFQLSKAIEMHKKGGFEIKIASKIEKTPDLDTVNNLITNVTRKYCIEMVSASELPIQSFIARSIRSANTLKRLKFVAPLLSFISKLNRVESGYWQNSNDNAIQNITIAKDLSRELSKISYCTENSNYAAVHIRLGDYEEKKNRKIYKRQDADRISQAVKSFVANPEISVVHILSNDLERAMDLCDIDCEDDKISAKSGTVLEDFLLLARATHICTSNSTFCWWATLVSAVSNKLVEISYDDEWFNNDYSHLDSPSYQFIESLICVGG